MKFRILFPTVLTAILSVTLSLRASQINLDVSDENGVLTITGTLANASFNETGQSWVNLNSIFTTSYSGPLSYFDITPNTFTLGGSSLVSVNSAVVSGSNLYLFGGTGILNFSTSSPAFTGSTYFNDSYLNGSTLQAVGTTGSITDNNGNSVGHYQVVSAVPEPSTYALFGLGALVVVITALSKKLRA